MRYTICYSLDNEGYVRMTTHTTIEASDEAQARAIFAGKHPGKFIVYIHPARDDEFDYIGQGAFTDEENAQHIQKLQERYDEVSRRRDPALKRLMSYDLDEFAAVEAYKARRESESTQNAEDIHVGDLFFHHFGYDMSCYAFYQVVGLKGKHTIVVKENDVKREQYDSGCGYCRPIRDKFYRETEYTVRTGWEFTRDNKIDLRVKPPCSSVGSWERMRPFHDGEYKEYDHND